MLTAIEPNTVPDLLMEADPNGRNIKALRTMLVRTAAGEIMEFTSGDRKRLSLKTLREEIIPEMGPVADVLFFNLQLHSSPVHETPFGAHVINHKLEMTVTGKGAKLNDQLNIFGRVNTFEDIKLDQRCEALKTALLQGPPNVYEDLSYTVLIDNTDLPPLAIPLAA